MVITLLIIIIKKWKQHRGPLTDEWPRKMIKTNEGMYGMCRQMEWSGSNHPESANPDPERQM